MFLSDISVRLHLADLQLFLFFPCSSVAKLGRNSMGRARGDDCAGPLSLLMLFRAASSPQDHVI